MDIKAQIFNGKINIDLLQKDQHLTLDSTIFVSNVEAVLPRHNKTTKLIDLRVITRTGEFWLRNVSMFEAEGAFQKLEDMCQLYSKYPKANVSHEAVNKLFDEINAKFPVPLITEPGFIEGDRKNKAALEKGFEELKEQSVRDNYVTIIDWLEETPWSIGAYDEALALELRDSCGISLLNCNITKG